MISESKSKVKVIGVNNKPFAMIIEPTFEVGLQVYEQAQQLAHQTGVRVVKCLNDRDVVANGNEVYEGCDIVVATPGRLLKFADQGIVGLKF
jgi:superfamily II DNA/RNA helicase